MEDKAFEPLTKMYSGMKQQFEEVNIKLDIKEDKTDIVRLENELILKFRPYLTDISSIRIY